MYLALTLPFCVISKFIKIMHKLCLVKGGKLTPWESLLYN